MKKLTSVLAAGAMALASMAQADTQGVSDRKQSRSKYGAKRPK